MGLFSSIGNIFNDVTGATSASKLNNKYQKEFAQNAHQWEVEDLKKAGLNPILSAGGSGATAGGAGGAQAGGTTSATDLLTAAAGAAATKSQIDKAGAETENLMANTAGKLEENKYIAPEKKSAIANLQAEQLLKKQQSAKTVQETNRIMKGKMGELVGTKKGAAASTASDLFKSVFGFK
nr:MAG TPA: minor capsid protein [Microviridae sp.]